ncbi:MAG: hypothetical protein EA412_01525 [Chitinophagaceae bacterium]|nr:MAG: hypothetical protein EA412_01525 [Chitinophagaceae bacterium]
MKVFKIVIAIILGLVGIALIIPLFVSNDFQVERKILVDVDKQTAHTYMGDLSNYDKWSPWTGIDPDMHVEVTGRPGQVGNMYKWKGNEEVGEGSMRIEEVSPDKISIHLHFLTPMESENKTYFHFNTIGEQTEITWSMEGRISYPWNMMLLFNFDEMIGSYYQKGLENLKPILEGLDEQEFVIEEINMPEKTYIGKRAKIKIHEMPEFYGEHMPGTYTTAIDYDLQIAGFPSGLYFSWDEENRETDMAVAIPVLDEDPLVEGYEKWKLGGNALKLAFYGDYEKLGEAHEAMYEYLSKNQLEAKSPSIQEYAIGPAEEPDTSKWLTNIYYLID